MKNKISLLVIVIIALLSAFTLPVRAADNPFANNGLAEGLPTGAEQEVARALYRMHTDKCQADTNTPANEANALFGSMPESSTWSNTTFKVDVGMSIVGPGQTATAESVLRGTYNLGSAFAVGVEGDFGAGNLVNEAYLVVELHKDLSDWSEVYATGGGGYSWVQNSGQGFFGAGTRVIPIGSIPQAAVFTELDFLVTPSAVDKNTAPSSRWVIGLTYHL